jgi:hypothetical protein
MTRQALFGTRADAKRFAPIKKRVLGGEKPRTTEKAFSEAEQVSSRWFRQSRCSDWFIDPIPVNGLRGRAQGRFGLFHEADYDEWGRPLLLPPLAFDTS